MREESPPFGIRPYEPADLEWVVAVYCAAVHSLAAPFYTAEELLAWAPRNQNLDSWRQRLAPVHTIVAEREAVIAGFAAYELNGHVDLLFTHPNFARRGVATCLYWHIESVFRRAGLSRAFTEASLASRRLFERCGFEVMEEQVIEVRSERLRRFAMQKPLRSHQSPRTE